MNETTLIGIDCATDQKKIGVSFAVSSETKLVVECAHICSNDRTVVAEVVRRLESSTRVLIALDAPLGWPESMGKALSAHQAGEALLVPTNALFRRSTDRFVKATLGKQPLDVGADRIARTAHAALWLLGEIRAKTALEIPLAWSPSFSSRVAAIEVYPAATLISRQIPGLKYKKKLDISQRQTILKNLETIESIQLPTDCSSMEENADALDAALCALSAYDFLSGTCSPPDDLNIAKVEGWIWFRRSEK